MSIDRELPEQPSKPLVEDITYYPNGRHVVVRAKDTQGVNYDIPTGELFPALTDQYRVGLWEESKNVDKYPTEKLI